MLFVRHNGNSLFRILAASSSFHLSSLLDPYEICFLVDFRYTTLRYCTLNNRRGSVHTRSMVKPAARARWANSSSVYLYELSVQMLSPSLKAIAMGVEPGALLLEDRSLHTRENAEYVLALLKERGFRRVILVTSPFHQLRTYLTFAKVFQSHDIEIINYHADTGEWHPATWFLSEEHRRLVKSS